MTTPDPSQAALPRIWWSCATAIALLLLLPLATVEIPPLLDYPNHLARMVVLARGAADPFLSKVYAQHWSIIPNIAIDALMPPLLSLLPLDLAGKLVLALTLLLPVAGCVAYHRASFRERATWPLGAALLATNTLFLLGFMNFLIGIGLAFFAAAAWIPLRRGPTLRLILLLAPAATMLFFVHIFALALFALLCAMHELASLAPRRPRLKPAIQSAAILAAVFAIPALLYSLSELADTPSHAVWPSPSYKFLQLFGAFTQYDPIGGIALTILIVAILAVSRPRIAPAAGLALLTLLALYPFIPFTLKDTAFIDSRLPIMAGFLLFAGLAPRHLPRGSAILLGLIFLLRLAGLTQIWQGQTADLAELRAAIADVPPGSRVLLTAVTRQDAPAYWQAMPQHRRTAGNVLAAMHLPALLIIERNSMWPLLFTQTTKQPLAVTPAYLPLTVGAGVPPSPKSLAGETATEDAPYLADWPEKFDYVLVLLAGGAGDLEALRPDRLQLVTRNDFAALLRVRHAP